MKVMDQGVGQTYAKARRLAYIYPVTGVLLIPLVLGLIQPVSFAWVYVFIALAVLFAQFSVSLKMIRQWQSGDSCFMIAKENLHLMPPGYIRESGARKGDFPYVTIILAGINTAVFFLADSAAVKSGMFFPYGDPSLFDCIVSIFTSSFLHDDLAHLASNMLVLWGVGSALESRAGAVKFLIMYLLSIVLAKAAVVVMLWIQLVYMNQGVIFAFHSLGASGAIAGLIGLFSVRCFFSRVTVTLPYFIPFVTILLQVNGILIIGLFLTLNLAGSLDQLHFGAIHINYWAHAGGCLFGLFLGYLMKLHHLGAEESVEVKADRFSGSWAHRKKGIQMYRDILVRDPGNEAALRYFLELKKFNQKEAGEYYARLMTRLCRKNRQEAMKIFDEYFPKYTNLLPGNVLLTVGIICFERFDIDTARICLDLAAHKEGPWQQKALFQLGTLYEETGDFQMAVQQYTNIIENCSDPMFEKEAKSRLANLEKSD